MIQYSVMLEGRKQAIKLRKEGKSYSEIEITLGIPRSTLSGWFKKEVWSSEIKSQLIEKNKQKSRERIVYLNEKRKENLELLYKKARSEAVREFGYLKRSPLFIVGIVAYWGGGDKTSKWNSKISNIDPIMIKSFIHFLEKICSIKKEKIRCYLLVYKGMDVKECEQFWSQGTGLPTGNFMKTVLIKGKIPTKRLHHGVCNVVVSSRYLKEKMLIWLSLLRKELNN